jgi:glycosyltransferase involved in cell wall biosynthesis
VVRVAVVVTRIAYLSYSSGEFDARSFRMARSAIEAGFEVVIYARWEPGLARVEEHDGYRVVRAPWDWRQAVPRLRRRRRRRGSASLEDRGALAEQPRGRSRARAVLLAPARAVRRALRRWWRLAQKYPVRPIGWSNALQEVAEPADLWHGMWAGSLPALTALRRKHGGHTVYDSRDVYMESRNLATAPRLMRPLMAWFERRWARMADRVITVNAAYATLLAERFGIPDPPVIMNCPEAWQPPSPRPNLIRAALGLPARTRVVLYQGQLISDRGIEQAMDAILDVPDAVLVLLGFGEWQERYRAAIALPPYAGRVHWLPPVHPSELVPWTASADVMLMPIQPTSLNHRFTTPQKLFESIAAGVPVVASDLPGMAEVVREIGAGALCDPLSPASIADAIRSILDLPDAELAEMQSRILAAAHDRYNWAAQAARLLALYRELLGASSSGSTRRSLPAPPSSGLVG